ncbi:MAG: hypothetical protein AAGD86_14815 [Pseudomonadota bacterium]
MKNVAKVLLLLSLVYSGASLAAPIRFDYVAHIDASDRPGAPTGTLLTGSFTYDPAVTDDFGGGNYFPDLGTAQLTARGEAGFFLSMATRVISVTPGAVNDTMTLQSFVSEDPNGWNMVFDFIEPGGDDGWLQGDSSLPEAFPEMPVNGFIALYFTDEGNFVRTVDATILSVTRSAVVPLPAGVWLLLSGLALLAAPRRR